MERKRASEASVARYRNNAAMPFFLKTKTVTSLSKAPMRARTRGENAKAAHFEKPVRHPSHLAHSFDYAPIFSRSLIIIAGAI